MRYVYLSVCLLLLLGIIGPIKAESKEFESHEGNLALLKELLYRLPNHFDLQFQYAQMAIDLEDDKEAEKALRHMLTQPHAHERIKLDLAMLYAKQGKYQESKVLFNQALKENPPKPVKENIEYMLRRVDSKLKQYFLKGNLTFGMNADTNANSAPSSGSIIFIDENIPLDDSSKRRSDLQYFGAASLAYDVKLFIPRPDEYGMTWSTDLTAFRSYQRSLRELDLLLLALKSGLVLELPHLLSSVGLKGGYTHAQLDSHEYLKSFSVEPVWVFHPNKFITYNMSYMLENRNFYNSPAVSTFSERSGQANQGKLHIRAILPETESDIFELTGVIRGETAKKDYNAHVYYQGIVQYTHLFGGGFFTTLSGGYKKTNYDTVDPLISQAVIRKDREKSVAFTIGKGFAYNVISTVGYQYRVLDSTIKNFEYDDHRIAGTLGVSF